jgi:DNA-binding XRE family transcriptional regulator
MANYKENQKAEARELYFTTAMRQWQIAEKVGVSEKTLSTWATEENWKAVKKANFHSPKVEIQRLYEELRVISLNISRRDPQFRYPTKEELDARTKIISLINALSRVDGQWRNIPDDHDLVSPPDFDLAPAETKLPQTSIFQ